MNAIGLREAIEHTMAAFFLTKPEGRIVDANHSACEMFGRSKEELIAIGRKGIIDESDPAFLQKLEEREQKGRAFGELIGVHKNGTRFPIEFSSVIFQAEDGEDYTSTFIYDISDRKRTQNELELLINNTAEAYILTDLDLKILSFNAQFDRMYKRYFGIEIRKGDWILKYAPSERLANAQAIYKRVFDGEKVTSEIQLTHPEDGTLHYTLTYTPAQNGSGETIGAFVTATNITERKNTERTLLESYQRFEYVTKATSDAIWDWNLETGKVYWGEGFHITYGYDKSITEGSEAEWMQRVHPDDIDSVMNLVSESMNSHQDTVVAEYRYLKADGTYAMVADRAVIIRNPKGNAIRVVGAMQDVTYSKHRERQRVLLDEIGHISARASNLKAMIDQTLNKIVFNGGYLFGEIWLVDRKQSTLDLTSEFKGSSQALIFHEHSKEVRSFQKNEGLPGLTWQTESVQIIQDVNQHSNFIRIEAARKAGLKSFFGLPLVVPGAVVGVLILASSDLIADEDLLMSQFDRIGSFLGMEIQRKQQEDLLRRISWEQSHLVRAPLARLLGLADLLQKGQETGSDVDEILTQIVYSARELDDIIRAISSSSAPTIHTPSS